MYIMHFSEINMHITNIITTSMSRIHDTFGHAMKNCSCLNHTFVIIYYDCVNTQVFKFFTYLYFDKTLSWKKQLCVSIEKQIC